MDQAQRLVECVESARHWLTQLDEFTIRHRPAPDRWTIVEVLGHLVDSAANNHQRFVRAQEVDELVFPKYEQNSWVEKNGYWASNWHELIELWCLYNRHLGHVIRNIPVEQLKKRCVIGPYPRCSLEFLVKDYVDHIEHHLKKIRERI